MKKFSENDIDTLISLLSTAAEYIAHPDVVKAFEKQNPQRQIIAIAQQFRLVTEFISKQQGKSLKRKEANAILASIQDVADILSAPTVARLGFSLPSTAIASRLREAIAELKKYTR